MYRNESNSSLPSDANGNDLPPSYVGVVFVLVASGLWGGMYVPVKNYKLSNGLYFQLIQSISLWTVGFVVHCIRDTPVRLMPFLGGFILTVKLYLFINKNVYSITFKDIL
jgi:hypothetical protein